MFIILFFGLIFFGLIFFGFIFMGALAGSTSGNNSNRGYDSRDDHDFECDREYYHNDYECDYDHNDYDDEYDD